MSSKERPIVSPKEEMSIERRRFLTPGPAGALEVLFEPAPGREVVGPTAVVCHPHPRGGGTLENKVVYTAARALRDLGYHTFRFNFRGTGRSEGVHEGTVEERQDVAAVLDLAREAAGPEDPVVLAGYSFGAWAGLPVGEENERVTHLIGIGLALGLRDFSFPTTGAKPLLVIQGTRDEFASPDDVYAWIERRPGPTRLTWIETGHFFHGKLDEVAEAITGFLGEKRREE